MNISLVGNCFICLNSRASIVNSLTLDYSYKAELKFGSLLLKNLYPDVNTKKMSKTERSVFIKQKLKPHVDDMDSYVRTVLFSIQKVLKKVFGLSFSVQYLYQFFCLTTTMFNNEQNKTLKRFLESQFIQDEIEYQYGKDDFFIRKFITLKGAYFGYVYNDWRMNKMGFDGSNIQSFTEFVETVRKSRVL